MNNCNWAAEASHESAGFVVGFTGEGGGYVGRGAHGVSGPVTPGAVKCPKTMVLGPGGVREMI